MSDAHRYSNGFSRYELIKHIYDNVELKNKRSHISQQFLKTEFYSYTVIQQHWLSSNGASAWLQSENLRRQLPAAPLSKDVPWPFPHHHLAFSSLSSFSTLFPCLGCKSLLLCGLCSLLFSDPEHTQIPTGCLPHIHESTSSHLPSFLSLFLYFCCLSRNHLHFKFIKESQIFPKCCSCSNSPSLPKIPRGRSQCFALPPPVQMPQDRLKRSWAQHWLCLLPSLSSLWLCLHGSSSVPAVHHGMGRDGKEIAHQDFIAQSITFCAATGNLPRPLQVLSSSTWGVIPQTRKPDWQVSPLWDAESGVLSRPLSCCWGAWAGPATLLFFAWGWSRVRVRKTGLYPTGEQGSLETCPDRGAALSFPHRLGVTHAIPPYRGWAASHTEGCVSSPLSWSQNSVCCSCLQLSGSCHPAMFCRLQWDLCCGRQAARNGRG